MIVSAEARTITPIACDMVVPVRIGRRAAIGVPPFEIGQPVGGRAVRECRNLRWLSTV